MKTPWLRTLGLLSLLFASTLIVATPAEARLRGDMEVAGAPTMPYNTPYEWAYDCEAELTDKLEGRERKTIVNGKEVEYDLWATAKFRLDKKRTFFSSDQLAWKWVAAYWGDDDKQEEPLAQAPSDAFSTRGHYGSLDIRPNWEKGADRVTLRGTATLPFAGYYHSQTETTDSSRDAESFSVKSDAILWKQRERKEQEPERLHRRLFIYCTKVK